MFQNISADRLETLLDQGRAFTLADVREPEEYREAFFHRNLLFSDAFSAIPSESLSETAAFLYSLQEPDL